MTADTGEAPQAEPADPAEIPEGAPDLAYASPEYRLMTRRFRQYRRIARGNPEAEARRQLGLPLVAFIGRHEGRDSSKREQITPILLGTLRMPEGRTELRDVDDRDTDDRGQAATRGRPGAILDTILSFQYMPPSAPAESRIEDMPIVRASYSELRDLRTATWPDRAGISGQYPVQGLAAVVDLLSAMSQGVTPRAAYAKTGVLRRPGYEPVWLRFGGPALRPTGPGPVTDDTARAELHPDYAEIAVLRELSYSLPSDDGQAAADLAAMFSALDVYPDTPALPVALIAELGWAPFSSDCGRITVFPFGDSGEAGKTSITDGLVVAAQSATHQAGPAVEGVVFNCRNKGTALGLDQAMHPARGSIVAADDIITKHLSRAELAKAVAKLDGILDGIAGGTGSVRGGHRRGGSVFSVNRAPTGCGVITAEDIPGEDKLVSLMGRAAAVSIANPADVEHWSKSLRYVQDHSREIGRAHSRFICDHLADLASTGRKAVDEMQPVTAAWQKKHGGHKRTVQTYARLAAGWVLYACHEARLAGIPAAEVRQAAASRIAYGLACLEDMFRDQAARSGMTPGARPYTDPAELFVRMSAEVLAGGPGSLYVADAELDSRGMPQPPKGLGAVEWSRLGWKARMVSEGMGARSAVWEPVTSGPPIGAALVHEPGAAGRRPRFGRRLMILPADLDKLTAAAAGRAAAGPVPLILSGGPALRAKLVTAGVLDRAEAEKHNPVWGEGPTRRRYVLDLDAIMAGTLAQDDPEPGPGGGGQAPAGPVPPAPEPEPEPAPVLPPAPPRPRIPDWEPGTYGAAANGIPDPPMLPEPGPDSDPAPAAAPAQDRSGPPEMPPPPEAPPDPYEDAPPPGPGRTAAGHTVRAERARAWPPRPEPREPMPREKRLADFGKAAALRFPGASARDVSAALDIFERTLGGLRFEGSPGLTGIMAFHWLAARYGSVPKLGRADEDAAEMVGGLKIRRAYTVTSPAAIGPDATWITGADVNAQYLAAGKTVELGTGPLQRIATVEPAHLKLPGYVRLDPAGLPDPFGAVGPGEWVPMPLAKLAVQWAAEGRCPQPVITEALVWPAHRRWLKLLSERLDEGRSELAGRTDLPGRIALAVLKRTYSTMYGGMIRSEKHNRTATLQPGWADMVKATGTANMWRALAKAEPAPALVYDPDAAYFAVRAEGDLPEGLTYSEAPVLQPGKWKAQRSCALTDEIRAAITAGKSRKARDLITAADKAHEGQR